MPLRNGHVTHLSPFRVCGPKNFLGNCGGSDSLGCCCCWWWFFAILAPSLALFFRSAVTWSTCCCCVLFFWATSPKSRHPDSVHLLGRLANDDVTATAADWLPRCRMQIRTPVSLVDHYVTRTSPDWLSPPRMQIGDRQPTRNRRRGRLLELSRFRVETFDFNRNIDKKTNKQTKKGNEDDHHHHHQRVIGKRVINARECLPWTSGRKRSAWPDAGCNRHTL